MAGRSSVGAMPGHGRVAVCVRGRGRRAQAGSLAAAALVVAVCSSTGGAQRYGYNDRGEALHWNEISSVPAWDAYPVASTAPVSLDELYRQGVKMLRVRVRGLEHTSPSRTQAGPFVSTEGVAMESSLALAKSTAETTETWTKARPCGEALVWRSSFRSSCVAACACRLLRVAPNSEMRGFAR
jgi:hypothetical protein